MPPSRQTFVLEGDVAANQLNDLHPKPGTRLRKLVDKKVIDTLFVNSLVVPVGTTSKRVDVELQGYLPAIPPDGLGIITTDNHAVFLTGTEIGVFDGLNKKITGQLADTVALNFLINLTTTLNVGITVGDPGDVAVGDTILIQNQGLIGPYQTTVTGKMLVGANYQLTFSNNFVQGPSQQYIAERVMRWEVFFRDSLGNLWPMPGTNIDLGVYYRQYLSDATEGYGRDLRYPKLTPQGVGSGTIGSFSRLEVTLDPGEVFSWYHGLDTDIPVFTWWVEWPGVYPAPPVRFYYGLQGVVNEATPTIKEVPVECKHLDTNTIEFHNKNSIEHRVKAIVYQPD